MDFNKRRLWDLQAIENQNNPIQDIYHIKEVVIWLMENNQHDNLHFIIEVKP